MRILILGGDGMIGYQLLQLLSLRHEVRVTLRQEASIYTSTPLFSASNSLFDVDARDWDRVQSAFSSFHPDVVINAVGIIKQRSDGMDVIPNLEINALLPHRLALICLATGARLIHISTDCVFSGDRGDYGETDRPDPVDIYGHCKLLGEVVSKGALTLRTSMIGLGLYRKTSLVDWFLSQTGAITGYRRAVFSGLTAKEIARVIEMLLTTHPNASGLYHLSASPINKYDLLVRLRDLLNLDLAIHPDDAFQCNRSLDSTRFRSEFCYTPPDWQTMLQELAMDIRLAN